MRHRTYGRLGCPVEACSEVIGGKWKGKIMFILFTGTKRFGELRKLLPNTTQRMLTMQLRELEEDGVVVRKIYAEILPKWNIPYLRREIASSQSLNPCGIGEMVFWPTCPKTK